MFIVNFDLITKSYDVLFVILADAYHDNTGLQVDVFLFIILAIDVLH